MIKHIVCWTFKDFAEGKSKQENLKEAKAILEGLAVMIKEVRHLEVGININPGPHAWDQALYAVFATKQDLEAYANHPEHLKVVEYLAKVRDQRVVVDYETY